MRYALTLIFLLIYSTCFGWSSNPPHSFKANVATGGGTISLNATAYASNLDVALLFAEGAGTNVENYADATNDGTINGTIWSSGGITVDASGEGVSLDLPTIGDTGTVMILFTSTSTSGSSASEYARLYSASTSDFEMTRNASDTSLKVNVDEGTAQTVPDLWDTTEKCIVVAWNTNLDTKKIYVDGTLEATDTTLITSTNVISTELYIGSADTLDRPAMVEISQYMLWTDEKSASDAAALCTTPGSMFNNYPW